MIASQLLVLGVRQPRICSQGGWYKWKCYYKNKEMPLLPCVLLITVTVSCHDCDVRSVGNQYASLAVVTALWLNREAEKWACLINLIINYWGRNFFLRVYSLSAVILVLMGPVPLFLHFSIGRDTLSAMLELP